MNMQIESIEKKELTVKVKYKISHCHGELEGTCELSKLLFEKHENEVEKLLKVMLQVEIIEESNEVK